MNDTCHFKTILLQYDIVIGKYDAVPIDHELRTCFKYHASEFENYDDELYDAFIAFEDYYLKTQKSIHDRVGILTVPFEIWNGDDHVLDFIPQGAYRHWLVLVNLLRHYRRFRGMNAAALSKLPELQEQHYRFFLQSQFLFQCINSNLQKYERGEEYNDRIIIV